MLGIVQFYEADLLIDSDGLNLVYAEPGTGHGSLRMVKQFPRQLSISSCQNELGQVLTGTLDRQTSPCVVAFGTRTMERSQWFSGFRRAHLYRPPSLDLNPNKTLLSARFRFLPLLRLTIAPLSRALSRRIFRQRFHTCQSYELSRTNRQLRTYAVAPFHEVSENNLRRPSSFTAVDRKATQ